jgi:hypothetical protein
VSIFLFIKIFTLGALFVLTGGSVFTEWGRRHQLLAVLAGFVAVVGSTYLMREIYDDLKRAMREELSKPVVPIMIDKPTDAVVSKAAVPPANAYRTDDTSQKDRSETLTPQQSRNASAIRASGNTTQLANTKPAQMVEPITTSPRNIALKVSLKSCHQGFLGTLDCDFYITNDSSDDRKICVGKDSRLVTDDGSTYTSTSNYLQIKLGGFFDSPHNRRQFGDNCEVVASRTKLAAALKVKSRTIRDAKSIQFLKFDCGSNCKFEAYTLEIK